MAMHRAMICPIRRFSMLLYILAAGCALAMPVTAQGPPGNSEAAASNHLVSAPDYRIGPGDILAITVSDAPEFTGKFRVSQSGELELTSLPVPLQAQGMTTGELAKSLAHALMNAKLYSNPTVNVYVDEFHSRNVTVVGAVAKPSVYPLQRRTTVLELISQAGGLTPTAGNKLTIVSGLTSEAPEGAPTSAARTIDMAKLMRGDDSGQNVEVHEGDIVSVSSAEVVYVVGAVIRPGGFVLPDQSSGVTVLQALALAQGLTSVASSRKAVIIRRDGNGAAREDVPIDVKNLLAGKTPDVTLQANDILFVPVSGGKQTLHVVGDTVMNAISGIAIYGVGYRAAGIN